MSLIDAVQKRADERIADERRMTTKSFLESAVSEVRALADALLTLAPAESMYLSSVASRLEIKVARLSKK